MDDEKGSTGLSSVTVEENAETSRSKTSDENEAATFEEAVTATKFGKLNLLLITIVIPTSLCSVFETTTMSYVFAAAHCDLELSLNHKGLINSITYAGMISSALIWGFLFDVLGRRRLLLIGFILDGLFVVMTAFSNNIIFLMIFKFLGGFIVNGPSAAMSSYLLEFHSSKYRPSMQMIIGTINSSSGVILPSLAWLILPRNLDYSFFNGAFHLHSWNFFLLAAACPPLFSGIIFLFMPESPKYLMTCGENEKALAVFQWVYSINTGKPKKTYPIKKLVDETKINENSNHGSTVTKNRSTIQALKEGFQQIKPMFFKPYLAKMILICMLSTCLLMSFNSLRLWFPQIFQAIDDYALHHNGTTSNLCVMIDEAVPKNQSIIIGECIVNNENQSVYIISIINGSVMVVGLMAAGSLIHFTGKKRILILVCVLAGLCSFGLFFSQSSLTTTILTSIFTSAGAITINVMVAVCVDLFPTTLRTLSVSMAYMTGRTGSMTGNLIFPFLLQSGCAPPFFVAGSMMLMAGLLSLLLPNTDNKAMH